MIPAGGEPVVAAPVVNIMIPITPTLYSLGLRGEIPRATPKIIGDKNRWIMMGIKDFRASNADPRL